MKNYNPQPTTIERKLKNLNISASDKETLSNLIMDPIAYMPDPRFDMPKQMASIVEEKIEVMPGDTLSSDQEVTLFTQMNYARHRMCIVRRKLLRKGRWTTKEVKELLDLNNQQLGMRSKIVTANMGLVLSMAKKVHYEGVEFTDLISEGSMALLRAVEKFNCLRGLKFSTYACQAIFKSFSRAAKDCYRVRNIFPAQYDPALEKDDSLEQKRDVEHDEMIDEVRNIFTKNIADLSDTEYEVIDMRFSISDADRPTLTLKEVGARLGLTKERIRQIQNKALMKLREATEERMATVY